MRRVILNMKDYIFADAVAKSLQVDEQGDFNPLWIVLKCPKRNQNTTITGHPSLRY